MQCTKANNLLDCIFLQLKATLKRPDLVYKILKLLERQSPKCCWNDVIQSREQLIEDIMMEWSFVCKYTERELKIKIRNENLVFKWYAKFFFLLQLLPIDNWVYTTLKSAYPTFLPIIVYYTSLKKDIRLIKCQGGFQGWI